MKKLLIAILLIPNVLFAITYSTKTVMQSGGNYTTLNNWNAGEAADLVANDRVAVAKIDGAWTSSNTVRVNLFSFTTDITRRIHIYTTTAGESANPSRSTGTWDTSKYIITNYDDYGTITISVPHVDIDGLQITSIRDGDNAQGIQTGSVGAKWVAGPYDVNISNNIFKRDGTGYEGSSWSRAIDWDVVQSTGVLRFYNNTVLNFGEGFYMVSEVYGSTVAVYNNTFWCCNSHGINFTNNGGKTVAYIKNNIITSTSSLGTAYLSNNTMIVSTQNITYDNTSPNTAYRNLRPNFNNVFATLNNPNLFLVTTDTCAYQRGQDLRTDPDGICNITTDLAGNAKTATPSMGALDYQPAAAPTNTIYRYFRSTWFK